MSTIRIDIGDVAGQRLHTYPTTKYRALVLFRVSHWLEVDTDAVEIIDLSGQGERLRFTAHNARAALTAQYIEPDTDINTERTSRRWRCTLDGTVILARTGKGRYLVELGMLRAGNLVRPQYELLAALWPVGVSRKSPWTYLWTSSGLGIESELSFDTKSELRTLLLPGLQRSPVAVAWYGEGSNLSVDELIDYRQNAQSTIRERLSAYLPGGKPWIGNHAGAARRWLVVQVASDDGLVTEAFAPFTQNPSVTVSRTPGGNNEHQQGRQELPDPAIIAELWAATDFRKFRLFPRGLVMTLLQGSFQATLIWNDRGKRSVFEARSAHASYTAGSGSSANRVSFVLAAGAAGTNAGKPVRVNFSPKPALETLDAVPMQIAAVSAATSIESADGRTPDLPRWIALNEGWLDLPGLSALSGTQDAKDAVAWLDRVAVAGQTLAGGVPLGELQGPEGLTAIVSEAGRLPGAYPGVRLLFSAQDVTLELFDATLIWRTPAWWVADMQNDAASVDLPDIAPAFMRRFHSTDDSLASARMHLGQAIADVFRSTFWVSHRLLGSAASGSLSKDSNGTKLALPSAMCQNASAWVAIGNAYLLSTRPHRGPDISAALLDGTRGLTRLTSPAGQLVLSITGRKLPSLAAHPFPDAESAPHGWTAQQNEMFHPHISGLGYLPDRQRFQYRHGSLMLAEGFLRQSLDSGLQNQLADDPIETVRPDDDIAIRQDKNYSFPLVGGKAQGLLFVDGWIPGRPVTIESLEVRYIRAGGKDPALLMTVITGRHEETKDTVEVSPTSNGFTERIALNANDDGSAFWLEKDNNGTFTHFGQPLTVAPHQCWFADGKGKRWEQFDQGGRRIRDSGTQEDHLSFTAYADLALSGTTITALLGISVVDATTSPEAGNWDLLGDTDDEGTPEVPWIGPFPVFPGSLMDVDRRDVDRSKLTATLTVGAPFVERAEALECSGGEVQVEWNGAAGGQWTLSTSAKGSYDWKFRIRTRHSSGAESAVGLQRLEGAISISKGTLQMAVTSVTLLTALGPLRFQTQHTPVEVLPLEDGQYAIKVGVYSSPDPASGFTASVAFQSAIVDGEAQWTIIDKFELGWISPVASLSLGLTRDAEIRELRMHPGAEPFTFTFLPVQSSSRRWGFIHTMTGEDNVRSAVAGSIEVIPGSPSPKLNWTIRASLILNPSVLFGTVLPGDSRVRADLHATCESNSAATGWRHTSSISGYISWYNDVSYMSPSGTVEHKVRLVFDQLPLSGVGLLPETFDAVVRHTLEDADDQEWAQFQSVNRFTVRHEDGRIWIQCASVLLLTEIHDPGVMQLFTQVRLLGDADIAMARAAHQPDRITGHVLRLFLSNAGTPVQVKVPAADERTIDWFPRIQLLVAAPLPLEGQSVWHERGAMADMIAPAGLSLFGEIQQPAGLSGGSFPGNNETLADWSLLFIEKGMTFQTGSLGREGGVVLLPFIVDVLPPAAALLARDTEPSHHALRVELLAVEPQGTRAALSGMASMLLNIPEARQSETLSYLAQQELKRQSSHGAAIVCIQGDPSSTVIAARNFHVSAVFDSEVPPALPVQPSRPALSEIAQGSDHAGPVGWQGPMLVTNAHRSVVEALSGHPVEQGPESARTTRLAVHAAWELPLDEPAGGAVAHWQSVHFARGHTHAGGRWPVWRAQATQEAEAGWTSVVPPLFDIVEWALRPGDMLHSGFGMVQGASAIAPPLEYALRAARPQAENPLPESLSLDSATAPWDGVDWRIYRISKRDGIGRRFTDPVRFPTLSVVTPREALHIESKDGEKPGAGARLTLGRRARAAHVNKSGQRVKGYIFEEPLLAGAFMPEPGSALPAELAIIRQAEPGSEIRDDLTVTVTTLLDAPDSWRSNPEDYGCLVLHRWDSERVPGTAQLNDPLAYDAGPAQLLQGLLEITDLPESAKAPNEADEKTPGSELVQAKVPWLLLQDGNGPALALVSELPKSGNRRVLMSVPITWVESGPTDQPERLLVISNDRIIGYGDFAGMKSIQLEDGRFILQTTCFALQQGATDGQNITHVWRFAPSGVCTASVTDPKVTT